jgi:hypothetical protein
VLFGFKTTWLAVRDRPAEAVADALRLESRETLPWDAGVERAYRQGVFVTPPVRGWILAHGRLDLLPLPSGVPDPGFPEWLTDLSRRLGDVQVFANERGWGHHAWAKASNGVIERAFAVSDGTLPTFIGLVTPAEREINRGVRTFTEEEARSWDDAQWDAWHESTPSEFDVLKIAARWSIDPTAIDPAETTAPGIYARIPACG